MASRSRVELGCAGHFIGAASCRWRRHTQVNGYRVSSVGEYRPRGGQREPLGAGPDSFFETMVFRTTDANASGAERCGCKSVANWSEIDGASYATAGEAQAGHERFVAQYAKKRGSHEAPDAPVPRL